MAFIVHGTYDKAVFSLPFFFFFFFFFLSFQSGLVRFMIYISLILTEYVLGIRRVECGVSASSSFRSRNELLSVILCDVNVDDKAGRKFFFFCRLFLMLHSGY